MGREGSNSTGSRSPAAPVAPGPSVFHMWKRRIFSIFFGDLIFFCGWGSRKQASEVTVWLARGHLLWNSANLKGGNSQPAELLMETHIRTGMWRRHEYWWTTKPSGLCYIANLFLYIHFKPYCVKLGFEKSLKAIINILYLQYVFLKALMFDKNECLGSITLLFMPKICPV